MAQGGPGYNSGDFMYPYGGEYGNEPNDMAYMNPPDMSSRGMNPPSMKYSRMTPPSYYYDNFPPYSDPVAPSNYYEDQFEPDDYQPHMWPEQEERRRKNPVGRGRRGMAYPSPDVHPEPIYPANQGMGDFSEDFSITSHEPNFDQVYQRNQQKWNKRGNSQQFDTGRFSQENMGPRGARPFSARGSSRGGVRGAMGGDSRGTGRGSQRGAGRGGTGRGSQRGAGRGAPRGAARGSPRGSSRGNTRAAQGGGVRGATRGRFNSNSGHFGHKMSAGPNYDQSSKKPWNQFGRKVAPIHSMARVVTTDPEIFTMAEKIRRFCLFLNSEPPKVNAIQTLQNALTGCKIGLKFDYQDEELMHVSNRWMFTGRLMLDEVFLARCVGPKKKEVKHECYNKALEVLKANTVAEILAKKDPGAETIREELKKKIEEKSENVGSLESLVLAKETADNITQQNQSPRTADFETLITYLQGNNPHPANCIARLEQAFVQSKCQLTHDCILESSNEPGTSRVMYRGSLKINGILIASEFGRRKKEAKLNTFTEALQALLTKPAAELMNGIPEKTLPGMDFSTPVVADSAESGMPLPKAPKKPPKEKDEPLKPLPVKIAEICGLMKKVMFTESFVNTLDTTALHLSLVPTCIFKRTASQEKEKGHMMICDLYLDDIMIATGEGYQRKDAQMDAYTNAYEVMTMYTPEYLVKNHKRLKPEDGEDPNVIEVNIKGTKKKEITDNIGTLKKFRLDYKDESKTLESMVILEHDDWSYDRRRQSFSILLYSCNQNGMLLEWTVEPEGSVFHKCTIKIQNEVVGEAVCQGKGNSKSLAAADALFRLYHRIPTVKVQKSDQPSISITFKEVEAKAEELKAKGEDEDTSSTTPTQISETNSSKPGSTQQDSSKPVVSPATSAASGKVDSGDVTVASGDKDSSDKKATERPANPWIVKAVRAFVEEFAKRKSIEEMSFGTGLSLSECRIVRSSARELGVQISFRVVEEELTLSVHCQLSPREIYNNLVKGDQQSGRYSLIPESELPPYSVVLEEKKKIESVQGLLLPRNEKK